MVSPIETVSIPKQDLRALERISKLLAEANKENTKHNAGEKLSEAIAANENYIYFSQRERI